MSESQLANMATLIGREVWYLFGGYLYRGKINRHDIDKNIATLNCGIHGPHDLAIPATGALLTVDSAITAVEETIEYLKRRLTELETIRDNQP